MLVILTIIVTGNHFVLDAIAGLLVMVLGFAGAHAARSVVARRRADAMQLAAAGAGQPA